MTTIVSELRDDLQNAVHAAIEAKSEEDRATTEAEKLAAEAGSRFQDAADIITDIAPAFPLVSAKATLGGIGKFLENYGGNVLWPTVDEAMLAYTAALDMNKTLKQIHEDNDEPCGEYKTFKLRFTECMPTYAGRSNFKAAAKERAIEMGLDQPGSIINPCFDPVEIAKAEVREAKAAEARAARDEYKDKAIGGQIRADLRAVLNRVTAYLPTLRDAAGIAEIPLDPEHEKQINLMKTRLANAVETMESQSIWADDFSDYKCK
tara:strand:+ start:208 stop:996 length:789 start_codon:yes stop_codon:yes gene_type:complete